MRTIHVPQNDDYGKWSGRAKGSAPSCVICGRGCPKPKAMILCISCDISEAIMPGDQPAGSDDGYFPIGADCLKRHPELLPFTKG